MRRLSFGLTGITLIASLTACGRADQQSGSSLSAIHRKVIPLTPGEYLVKITKATACNTSELSVTQHWEYPEPTEAINPLIELNSSDDITSPATATSSLPIQSRPRVTQRLWAGANFQWPRLNTASLPFRLFGSITSSSNSMARKFQSLMEALNIF